MKAAHHSHRARTHSGFTLVEMLVVLGIILVLMSILIPVVIGANRQARKTARCWSRSNARTCF